MRLTNRMSGRDISDIGFVIGFTIFITFGMAMLAPPTVSLWLYDVLEGKIDSFVLQ